VKRHPHHGPSSGGLPSSIPSQSVSGGGGFGSATANAGDVDGDGYGDLVVGAVEAGVAYVFTGSPTGVISAPQILGTGEMNYGESVGGAGDVNGDGYSDVVVCDRSGGTATVYLGSATGLGRPLVLEAPTGETAFAGQCASAGDVNGDGYADIVVASYGSGNAYLYYGSATGIVTASVTELGSPQYARTTSNPLLRRAM
jgi:hypothetical protein